MWDQNLELFLGAGVRCRIPTLRGDRALKRCKNKEFSRILQITQSEQCLIPPNHFLHPSALSHYILSLGIENLSWGMEEEKRRKKNRKKKNKQSKTVEDGVAGGEETATRDQNLVNNGKDEHSQLSEATDERSTNVDSIGQRPNGKECPVEVEDGKQQWLEKEVISEEIIRKLRSENDMLIQKEVRSEETIKKLKEENDMHIQKEATSEETIRKLKEENDVHIQKEAISEKTIRKLKEENDIHIQKEAIAEETIRKLKEENDMYIQEKVTLEDTINHLRTENELQVTLEDTINHLRTENELQAKKQAGLEEKSNQLLNEKEVLSLKGEGLEERINQLERELCFSIEEEKSSKETMSNLNGDISRLQLQVAELEESKYGLWLENQQLKENVSGLQSTVQNLEKSSSSSRLLNASAKDFASENEDLKSQIEAARVLVEKLVAENAELVEKVNELYVELDQRSAVVGISGATRTDELAEFAKPDDVAIPIPESVEIMSMSAQELNPLEEAPIKDNNDTIDAEHATGVISSSSLVSDDSGEIVQIPLDDIEVQNPELQAAQNLNMENDVPITDAPLIGAPFRLISFVAKYVSGADLINESSSNPRH